MAMTTMESATTFAGLNQTLESRWPIRKACQAVEICLDTNRWLSWWFRTMRCFSCAAWHGTSHMLTCTCHRDNYRGFFEQCFSNLLKQIFGYDGSSWLNAIAQVPLSSCVMGLAPGALAAAIC